MMFTKREYLLLCLSEELGEVAQNIIKALRFTEDHQYYEESNIERVQKELTDVFSILTMLEGEGLRFSKTPCFQKMERTEMLWQLSNRLHENLRQG